MQENIQYSKSYKNAVLFVICMAAALVPFMGSSVNLALVQIAKDYQINSITQSWILTAFLISSAIFQVPFGRMADIVGRKRVFMYGLLIITLSSAACALPYGGIFLIVCRAMQGIGSAMIFGTGMAMITAVFDAGERGRALGINVAVVYLSLALGPSAGGLIMYYWGWQSIFLVIAVLSLIACIGCRVVIKQQWVEAKGESFDLLGAFMYGVALFLLIYGFTILPAIAGFLLILIGIILFIYFIKYEKKQATPVLNVKLFFTNRLFTYSSIAALINYAVTFPISFFMSLYLQEVKGLGVQYAGLILIVQPAVQAILSPVAGRLSDKTHSHYLASAGMGLISLALLLIALFVNASTPMLFIVFIFVLLGVGFAAFSSPNTNTIMGSVEKRDYSMASATSGTMRLTGQAFSMGITTMILSLFLGKEMMSAAVTDKFMGAMQVTFIIFAVLSLLGIYASMRRNTK